jgi:CheY-like chemotaxis protein
LGVGNKAIILQHHLNAFYMKKICFLIDDDADDQEIFSLALNQINDEFECQVASNGLEGLQQLRKSKTLPDYIFLDLNMPKMNGKECLKEIKKNDRLKAVPVIIYSTSSSTMDMADTKALGATAFITKPFSLTELTETLSSFFETHVSVTLR